MLVAEGSGCQKGFVCRYHGWTYGLDGRLRHVPHEHGFPGLDKSVRGLVPVETVERCGLVFVTQDEPARSEPSLDELPVLLGPTWRLRGTNEGELGANWKILAEGFLEGYHIRTTHRDTFYPIQYDNLNVVESFGRNSRIVFPYQRIEKLRGVPEAERSADGMLTYVYHLFPNVMFATFPHQVLLVVLEPVAVDRTRLVTYALTEGDAVAQPERGQALERSRDFLVAGTVEDNTMAQGIQRALPSRANQFFEFGRFEGAIGHFHRALHAALEEPA
jgi:phenylpropionate dioxygenase-like ring-hydroxylating dioxygenase large terminal subunit